ncbi:trans-aconitate 2-methyltransferase [Actinosynnema sp. NPDC047251]|uniref:Trans-aconitate 2-methyltransferase n=1 Tax=Saccharothrix espanaensis (strain ATCC 51144 / DSM 44229 / JCM 9112 / NBRC 15066 / NRRL 15764) TaxID=1179773 RepID=K0JSJ4_SACES|nr:trans-aconitate 2-methyltransferase [Saccharothrix espanaensis]CCH28851.1 Trans-aconitate 2-methyltransferase [Saccharothrix espanaensis DSM 44229]
MWDPVRYLTFADHRSRPFHELVARIAASSPRRVVDLGCGPGNLTTTLAARWPEAVVEALDSSAEMVAAARERGLDARVQDITTWMPREDTDVVVTNAVLQWVPGHEALLRRWVDALPSGAWLGMQVPGNFDGPSHAVTRGLIACSWPELAGTVRVSPVLDPAGYADVLAAAEVDAWETTYLQRLTGADAVLEWITGTALRPVRAALDDAAWAEFRAQLAPLLRAEYPRRPDGTTWFPFRRVFAVARVR